MLRKTLHRHLWQRLPRTWRRAFLFHMTSITAPRPTTAAKPCLPILVAGALRAASGLGESARLSHDALKAQRLPVYGLYLTEAVMQPVGIPDFVFEDGRDCEGPGILLLHVNAPFMPLALLRIGRRLVRDKYIIGYWAWELPQMPQDWRFGVPFVHEIWAPSNFTAQAIRPISQQRAVQVVPHPVAFRAPTNTLAIRSAKQPFTVLSLFDTTSSFARKNPLAVISAFRQAFGNDASVHLILKASCMSGFSAGRALIEAAMEGATNITLIDRIMSFREIDALYAESDVVMSLHRSEGFGLTIAEAMCHGLPVIATDWSGNVDFVTAQTGIPVPFRFVAAEDPQGTYHHPDMNWAEVNVEAAASALRRLREDRQLSSRLGQAGADFAKRSWCADVYANTVCRLLSIPCPLG